MPTPCPSCRLNKKRIFFDIEKAVIEAKKLAIENEQTYAVYKEGKSVSYTDAATAAANGYTIIQMVSKYQ
jgi:uncharacterized FlgJ-related protein